MMVRFVRNERTTSGDPDCPLKGGGNHLMGTRLSPSRDASDSNFFRPSGRGRTEIMASWPGQDLLSQ